MNKKRIFADVTKKGQHDLKGGFPGGSAFHQYGPLQDLPDIPEDGVVKAVNIPPMAGANPITTQLPHGRDAGAIGVIVVEASGKGLQVHVQDRHLEDGSQQGVAGNGVVAAEVDQVALRVTGTREPVDAEGSRYC